MSISRLDSKRCALAGAAIVVLIGTGSVVSGQRSASGVPATGDEILATLGALAGTTHNVEAGIDRLQSDVDALQVSVDIVAKSTVRTTPDLWISTTAVCMVRNVSGGPRTIKIELVNYSGAIIETDTSLTAPGTTEVITGSDGESGPKSCRFTVLDGTRADIRGSLSIARANNALDSLVAVAAE
jgi:hypothetical protein